MQTDVGFAKIEMDVIIAKQQRKTQKKSVGKIRIKLQIEYDCLDFKAFRNVG